PLAEHLQYLVGEPIRYVNGLLNAISLCRSLGTDAGAGYLVVKRRPSFGEAHHQPRPHHAVRSVSDEFLGLRCVEERRPTVYIRITRKGGNDAGGKSHERLNAWNRWDY